MGVSDERADASIRFGLGRFNTDEDVQRVADVVVREVRRLRETSELWRMKQDGLDPKSFSW